MHEKAINHSSKVFVFVKRVSKEDNHKEEAKYERQNIYWYVL